MDFTSVEEMDSNFRNQEAYYLSLFKTYDFLLLIENKANLDYWKAPENLSNETRPSSINIKRILSERTIGLNEKLRNKYKRKPIRT